MSQVYKYTSYASNILKSYFYDIRYSLFNFRERALSSSYRTHKANKDYPSYLKNGAAIDHIKDYATLVCTGIGLDIGANKWPLGDSRPIDDTPTENAYSILEQDASMDYIFSSHVLEHLSKPLNALREWYRVLKSDGIVFLYLPHPVCKMWLPEHLKGHLWSPSPNNVKTLVEEAGFEVVENSDIPDSYLSFYLIARKVAC